MLSRQTAAAKVSNIGNSPKSPASVMARRINRVRVSRIISTGSFTDYTLWHSTARAAGVALLHLIDSAQVLLKGMREDMRSILACNKIQVIRVRGIECRFDRVEPGVGDRAGWKIGNGVGIEGGRRSHRNGSSFDLACVIVLRSRI